MLSSCERRPPIQFTKEDISIEVKNDTVSVTGIYFFENTTHIRKRITFYYPFPVDSNHTYPDTIILAYPYEKDSTGILFTMSINAMATHSFEITYVQHVRHHHFTYITTTTKRWNRPIREACFTIGFPESLHVNCNYAPYKTEKIDNKNYIYILKEDFYPEEDLRVEWITNP